MAYEIRQTLDYRFGQLSAGATALDTTLQSPAFAGLPSDLSTTKYLPIVIADDTAGTYEVVWVTGHAASSTSVTVVRGREGSTARGWSAGATWRHAPTSRDVVSSYTRATLPADAHLGMRAAVSDEGGQVVERVLGGGWVTPFGYGYRRLSRWSQSNGGLANSSSQAVVSGMTAVSGFQSSPATYNNGVVLLNAAGIWSLQFEAYVDPDGPRIFQLWLDSGSNGHFPGQTSLTDARQTQSTPFAGYARVTPRIVHVGYFPDAVAKLPFTLRALTTGPAALGAITGISYGFTAELLGG